MKIVSAIIIVLAVIAIIYVFCNDQNKRLDITRYSIKNKSNNATIVHLSDLHSTAFNEIVPIIEAEKPDLIAITGDLINDRGKNIAKMMDMLVKLNLIAPVYYVPGNHEHRLDFFDSLMDKIKATGTTVLQGEIAVLEAEKFNIAILGLDENQASFENYAQRKKGEFVYSDNSQKFTELRSIVTSRENPFRLALTHYPENFALIGDKSYNQFDFDLMLAGHAHGGQFRLKPFGPIYSPGQGLLPKYAQGIHGERPKLIVSRGLGNAEFPLRLFNHPELIVINIT